MHVVLTAVKVFGLGPLFRELTDPAIGLFFKKYSRLYAMIETRGASKYAFSYASIGGKVTMTLAQEEPYIRLRVYNTGAPIDQKDLPHL